LSPNSNLGANWRGNGKCDFLVWAPLSEKVEIHVVAPHERFISMKPDEKGYYRASADGLVPGYLYFYKLDGGRERPDPASKFQPYGVHGPSQIMNLSFSWNDRSWTGIELKDYIIYELHVGTFTAEGTFTAIIPYLAEFKSLGITALEIMPVAQFPGDRNWGYDGVLPYATQNSYGGPEGLQQLVNACHQEGLAVILDVVYNHLGPEGNYLRDFGHYFTDRYCTPWGEALNFDGPFSDDVRRFYLENAAFWISQFHIDALRIDAVHAILDHSPRLFLEELATIVHEVAEQTNRHIYAIAESHLNDARLITSSGKGGYGLDAVWNDDFHHSLQVLLTGNKQGYYEDFGNVQHLARAYKEGFVYSGEYAPFWKRRRGTPSLHLPAQRFIVFSQNHDQIGNRMLGERLSQLVPFDSLKLATACVILSPCIPLLFMGEEYAETAPFYYFISHSDPELVEAVRRGRQKEFASFKWQGTPPDPQDESTFQKVKLNHNLRNQGNHKILLEFYRELFRLRKELPALHTLSKEQMNVISFEEEKAMFVQRWSNGNKVSILFNFNNAKQRISPPFSNGKWKKILDSAEQKWGGSGSSLPDELSQHSNLLLQLSPLSIALYSS
jgi:maltooligosyltrehalose trehalohydrolase